MQKWEYYLVLTHLVVLGESRTTPPGKTQTVSRLGLSEQQEEYLDLKVLLINGKRPKSPLFLSISAVEQSTHK